MTRATVRLTLLVIALAAAAADRAVAQGTLSTQGLGFPPGLLSAKAQAMGGSIAEADGFSLINPASISMLPGSWVTMQVEPEFRELRSGGQRERTSVARFPVFLGSMQLGTRWTLMASAGTLFDRTWATSARDSQVIGADTVRSSRSLSNDGAVADLRFAVSYQIADWLRVGIGAHAFTGRDALTAIRLFDDTARFVGDTQRTAVGFGGGATSLGAQLVWPSLGALGVTYRRGGDLRTYSGTTVVQTAAAPDHFGVSAAYLGIEGTTLAVRVAHDAWSRLNGLSPSLVANDAWDIGAGAEVLGPTIAGSVMGLRAGGRWRTLPFSASPTAVRERSFSGGFGLPIAQGRAELNMAVVRSTRSGPDGLAERAWTLSTAFSVRP